MLAAPHFLINPAAAGGRARRWWQAALPVLRKHLPDLTFAVSDDHHSLAQLVTAALADGRYFLVGVGGDGTHHDIINALVRQGALSEVTYAPLPLGTGNDWCRTLGVPRHILRWIPVLQAGKTIPHRIGKLTYHTQGAGPQVQYFINVAGMAYDAEVVRRSAKLPVSHGLLYPLLTLGYLPDFTPPELDLQYDGTSVRGRFHTINLGIGRYNGGGMRLVPQADPTADTLALTYAVGLPTRRILANGWRFYTNSIGRVEGVTTTHATDVRITGITGLEADGEWLGQAPVTAGLLPERLRVVVGN
ncbi:Putative lipid kinase YtlR [Neolewinella maritima]|uniref:Lipid kinase YtlR n=1 Tax=Neolewinella maritima TaxID=1383882 RepID=A0ABM9AXC5_9BACT|nr:diacylglycerol kinase family protein [Neolewinella maritima]CAH0999360.1 Putative lipid kinase YtlR [Neolewinella maritima]